MTWQQNSSFSKITPKLQLYWDSVSTGLLKECARKYQLAIIEGWTSRQTNYHLLFGIWMHEAKERYDRARAQGKSHDEGVLAAVRHVMCATWNKDLKRPWDSGDTYKNRFTLLRTIVWYFSEYAQDPIETVIFANGKPAVELSFSYDTTYKTQAGETFSLCGHIDRIGKLNNQYFPCDIKTSKHQCDSKWFAQWSPNNQFSGYMFACKVVYGLPTHGLIVDGVQVAVTFSRPARDIVHRSESQLEEWYSGMGFLFKEAESYALADFWPMREASCNNYGGCGFRSICSRPPESREVWLKSDFIRRTWDPLVVRGDI